MRIDQHLIWEGTQTKAPLSIAAHIASYAIDFFRVMKKSQLLPLNAADRAWSNPIGIEKGGEHQSQILSFKRRTTCPLKRGRSNLPVRVQAKVLTNIHPSLPRFVSLLGTSVQNTYSGSESGMHGHLSRTRHDRE